jgi:hypothetical protein
MAKRPDLILAVLSGHGTTNGSSTTEANFMSDANCRSIADPDLFFSAVPHAIHTAKTICRSCPVVDACLLYGASIEDGIFGGLTPTERGIKPASTRIQKPTLILLSQQSYLQKTPVSLIAAGYGVQPRTVQRWRKILKNHEQKDHNETQR